MNEPGEDMRGLLARALPTLMRPLVRALIANGVTAPAFYGFVKRIYVEVAEREFALDDDRPTDSRISLLTGVHRRDVKALREDQAPAEIAPRKVTAIATLIGRWLAEPAYQGEDGPIAVPRSGPAPSFDALAAGVSQDVRPRTMLDEMLRQGLAEETEEGLRLVEGAVLGPADLEQKMHFFAENVGDHMQAAVGNLLQEDPRFMERAVFYNRLTPASLDEIEAEARTLGQAALTDLNRMARERQTTDAETDAKGRFRFGVFFYREDEDDE